MCLDLTFMTLTQSWRGAALQSPDRGVTDPRTQLAKRSKIQGCPTSRTSNPRSPPLLRDVQPLFPHRALLCFPPYNKPSQTSHLIPAISLRRWLSGNSPTLERRVRDIELFTQGDPDRKSRSGLGIQVVRRRDQCSSLLRQENCS